MYVCCPVLQVLMYIPHVSFTILIKSIYEVTDFAETTGAVQ